MMTPVQILLVQSSFEMVGADGRVVAASLARRLPRIAAAEQVAELAAILVLAVRGLSRRRFLAPALRRLGARHAICRIVAQDRAFSRALLEALEEALDATLPATVREAWSNCHQMVAALVREGGTTGRAIAFV